MNADSKGRRIGRPPAGAKDGERVKDYPQVSVRVPAEIKACLNALRVVTGLAQWRVIVEALDCFRRGLPPGDQRLVEGLRTRFMKAKRAPTR